MPLTSLDLRLCSLVDDEGLAHIQHLPLTSLYLGGCTRVSGAGIGFLRKMSLHHLDLRGCAIDASVDGITCHLSGMPLEYLDLGISRRHRDPTRTAVTALVFPLAFLVLGGFHIGDVALGHLQALEPTLKYLDVRGCTGLEAAVRESLLGWMVPPQKTLLIDPEPV